MGWQHKSPIPTNDLKINELGERWDERLKNQSNEIFLRSVAGSFVAVPSSDAGRTSAQVWMQTSEQSVGGVRGGGGLPWGIWGGEVVLLKRRNQPEAETVRGGSVLTFSLSFWPSERLWAAALVNERTNEPQERGVRMNWHCWIWWAWK